MHVCSVKSQCNWISSQRRHGSPSGPCRQHPLRGGGRGVVLPAGEPLTFQNQAATSALTWGVGEVASYRCNPGDPCVPLRHMLFSEHLYPLKEEVSFKVNASKWPRSQLGNPTLKTFLGRGGGHFQWTICIGIEMALISKHFY